MEGRQNNGNVRVAQILIGARTDEGLTRSEAATKSGVPERYIAFFEGDPKSGVTADVFARNKLAEYCRFLRFDPKTMVAAYRSESQFLPSVPVEFSPRMRRHPLTHIPTAKLLVTPNVIRTSLIALAVFGVGLFFAVRTYHMVAPPMLTLASPQDGLVIHDKMLTIEGRTEREVQLLVNGKLVTIDGSGNFTDQMDLRDGLNVITVTAARRHGKSTELTRRVVVDPRDRTTAALDGASER